MQSGLTRRFLDLVTAVLGLAGDSFVRVHSRIDDAGWETTRSEHWRYGELLVTIEAQAIESGHGIHGERCTFSVANPPGDGRDVTAYTDIDMRYGGALCVTVSGVFDAQALADRFVA